LAAVVRVPKPLAPCPSTNEAPEEPPLIVADPPLSVQLLPPAIAMELPAKVAASVEVVRVNAVPPVPSARTRFWPATEVIELMPVSAAAKARVPVVKLRLLERVTDETAFEAFP
jgi:hypothetical protein